MDDRLIVKEVSLVCDEMPRSECSCCVGNEGSEAVPLSLKLGVLRPPCAGISPKRLAFNDSLPKGVSSICVWKPK